MSHGKGSPWAAALIPRALDPPSGQVSLEILLWLRLGEKLKAHGGRSEAGSAQGTLHSAVPSIHHSVSAPHATLPYPQTQRICGVPSERTIPIFAAAFPPARSELWPLFICLLFTCPLAYFPSTWINSSPTVLCCHSSRFPKEEVNVCI